MASVSTLYRVYICRRFFKCFIFELKAKQIIIVYSKFTIGKKIICINHIYFFDMLAPLLFEAFTPYA